MATISIESIKNYPTSFVWLVDDQSVQNELVNTGKATLAMVSTHVIINRQGFTWLQYRESTIWLSGYAINDSDYLLTCLIGKGSIELFVE
jgi:hypothetical protein